MSNWTNPTNNMNVIDTGAPTDGTVLPGWNVLNNNNTITITLNENNYLYMYILESDGYHSLLNIDQNSENYCLYWDSNADESWYVRNYKYNGNFIRSAYAYYVDGLTGKYAKLYNEYSGQIEFNLISIDISIAYYVGNIENTGYSITYSLDGGTLQSGVTNPTTDVTSLPNPLPTATKEGYTFDGWYTDSTLTTEAVAGTTITADATLYARFTANNRVTALYKETELPTLNTPSISLSGNTLTITNPITNGNFVTGYKVYSGGIFITSTTSTTVSLSTYLTEDGTYTITVKASGTGLNDSAASNSVNYVVSSAGAVDFATDDWVVVKAEAELISSTGNANNSPYNIGDTRTITLSTGEVVTLRIIGFNHDTLATPYASGGTLAGITVQFDNCLATTYKMNNSNTNTGGWRDSLMRSSTAPLILSQMDTAVRNAIAPVVKQTALQASNSTIINTTDSLWLLSMIEVNGSNYRSTTGQCSYLGEGEQYAYYANAPIPTGFTALSGDTGTFIGNGSSYSDRFGGNKTTSANIYYNINNAKGNGNTSTTAVIWWLRSPRWNNSDYFCYVVSRGDCGYTTAGYGFGASLGFCV